MFVQIISKWTCYQHGPHEDKHEAGGSYKSFLSAQAVDTVSHEDKHEVYESCNSFLSECQKQRSPPKKGMKYMVLTNHLLRYNVDGDLCRHISITLEASVEIATDDMCQLDPQDPHL